MTISMSYINLCAISTSAHWCHAYYSFISFANHGIWHLPPLTIVPFSKLPKRHHLFSNGLFTYYHYHAIQKASQSSLWTILYPVVKVRVATLPTFIPTVLLYSLQRLNLQSWTSQSPTKQRCNPSKYLYFQLINPAYNPYLLLPKYTNPNQAD